jgi:hypothetical protein
MAGYCSLEDHAKRQRPRSGIARTQRRFIEVIEEVRRVAAKW